MSKLTHRKFLDRLVLCFGAVGLLCLILGAPREGHAQIRSARPVEATLTPKAGAVIDMTGFWVAIVDEDWRWRMVTPAKGDFASLPINDEAKRVAMTWDPAKDKAEGNDCKSYGAGNIMRIPERLHITWTDDNTMQMDIDAGMQKRVFHFDGSKWQGGQPQWQGDSVAKWEKQAQFEGGFASFGGPQPGKGGALHVTTTHMRAGYLRKNGIPYSENATLTEYYNVFYPHGPQGVAYLIVTSAVDDPKYLKETFITSGQFKREPDGSKWDPTPCRPLWPLTASPIPKGWNEDAQ
jgi:hypothetical protein